MNLGTQHLGRQSKRVGSAVVGVLLIVFGAILTIVFGALLVSFCATGTGNTAAHIVFLIFLLLGVVMLAGGVRRWSLYQFSQQVLALMQGKDRERLSLLAQFTRRDNSALVRDLRELAAGGVFPGAYVDLNRREFVASPGGVQPPIVLGNTQLKEQRRASVLPIYLIGATWFLYALLFPMYRWFDFVIAAVASLLVYIVSARLVPRRTVIKEVPRKVEPPRPAEKINTGNEELDEVLTTAMSYMNELTALDIAITNERIDGPVQDMVRICTQIFDYVKKTPKKVRQIRQFMNYYLPTAIGLLKNYDELSRQPVKGDNIRASMTKIEDTILVILKAFEKELDNLYEDKALDISVDIEVLQNMMEQEGLTGTAWQPRTAQAELTIEDE